MAARSPILGVKHTAPSFEVTRNACDCHAHGFGPDDRFPFLPKRLYTPGSASTEDLNALHRTLNIDRAPIARAMIVANVDRVMWDTDWPHPNAAKRDPTVIEPFRPEDDGAALNRLASWTKNRTELTKILVDNPARLYQF